MVSPVCPTCNEKMGILNPDNFPTGIKNTKFMLTHYSQSGDSVGSIPIQVYRCTKCNNVQLFYMGFKT
jgi:hypothetical protein